MIKLNLIHTKNLINYKKYRFYRPINFDLYDIKKIKK